MVMVVLGVDVVLVVVVLLVVEVAMDYLKPIKKVG